MFEFRGEVSKDMDKFLLRLSTKLHRLFTPFFSVLIAIAGILLGLLVDPLLFIGLLFVPFFIIVMSLPQKQGAELMRPTAIIIEYGKVWCEQDNLQSGSAVPTSHELDEIIEIDDYGDWYHFVFDVPFGKTENFVAQKDLIVKGTIEDFEEFFKDKIVRKEFK